MTTALTRMESDISSLRSEIEELRGASWLRVPIQTLEPEPFKVLSPMEAVIRRSSDGFLATFFDANVNASGDTETEAFENLKDMIVATFSEYTRLGGERLGPEPARQFAVLKHFVGARGT